ncbi:MAG: hypothetical protein E6Q97_14460 [Desulfurellales bacterium]|nr:MAG: hypothetical protein E6Q97_14460 [Desulfurellales bacterium]
MKPLWDVLNLGAGVGSTTIHVMTHRGELPPLDAAVFADTGEEPTPVYAHLQWCVALGTPRVLQGTIGRLGDHLLAGSPQEQMRVAATLAPIADVRSADGNMMAQQSRKGRFWSRKPGRKGHWRQLSEVGDDRTEGVPLECFRRSLEAIREAWGAG